jgi:hypothetical protein
MWSKELKKKKRISADTVQTFGVNSGLSSNSSGSSNSGTTTNSAFGHSLPIAHAEHAHPTVSTSNLLHLGSNSDKPDRVGNVTNGTALF